MCDFFATIFFGIIAIAIYKPDPRACPRGGPPRPLDKR